MTKPNFDDPDTTLQHKLDHLQSPAVLAVPVLCQRTTNPAQGLGDDSHTL